MPVGEGERDRNSPGMPLEGEHPADERQLPITPLLCHGVPEMLGDGWGEGLDGMGVLPKRESELGPSFSGL